MKKTLPFLLLTLLFATAHAQVFTLRSNEIGGQATNKQVFNSFGCTGENLSPQLFWENVPAGTKSFAVTMYDPDAPTGSGWWHWLIFDIPVAVKELKTDAGNPSGKNVPAGAIQSMTDFGQPGYGGPCPPQGHGFHTYVITVYALDTDKLGLDAKANPAYVGFSLNSHTIQKATIVMYFKQ